MTVEPNEDIYKRLAETYAQHQGESLLAEQQGLEQQGAHYLTPRADAQVRQATAKRRRSRRAPLVVAAAACLFLFVVGSTVAVNLFMDVFSAPSASMGDSTNDSGNSTPSADLSKGDWDSLRPLGFTLPARFSLSSSDFDNGMSVYWFADTNHEEVVLTMQKPGSDDASEEAMDTVYIDGEPVPAKITSAYKLLRFEEEGVVYTLSCKADLEALVVLYQGIRG